MADCPATTTSKKDVQCASSASSTESPSSQKLPTIEELLSRARIGEDEVGDPRAYVRAHMALYDLQLLYPDERKGVDIGRLQDGIEKNCEARTGITFKDASRRGRDVISTFISIMESDEKELLEVEKSMMEWEDIRLSDSVKKKYCRLIRLAISLQHKARENPGAFAIYVGRNDDSRHAGQVIRMARCHKLMYDIWMSDVQNSLIFAPPGHGKSVNLRYMRAWEIGHDPSLRCLYVTDGKDKASAVVRVLKSIIKSGRYHAVFPDVRVLGRTDDTEDSSLRFTVYRLNEFAKDPTVEGLAVGSTIQGNRYDRIDGDDFCPPEVRDYKTIREQNSRAWWGAISTRVADDHSRIRITCTPWHPDDVYGQIERAVANGSLTGWLVEKNAFRIRDDKQGRAIPIWDKWSSEYFERRKATDGRNYDFCYRLNPSSTTYASVSKVLYYNSVADERFLRDNDKVLLDHINLWERWLSIDPAGTTGSQSSHTGIVEVIISPNGYVFIPRVWFIKAAMNEVMEMIRDLVLAFRFPGYTGIQWEMQGAVKVGMDSMFYQLRKLLEEAGVTNIPRMIYSGAAVGANHTRSKETRLQACSSMFSEGCVRFAGRREVSVVDGKNVLAPIPGSDMERFTTSILEYDRSNTNDAIDALTQWVLLNFARINKPRGIPLPQKVEQEEDGKSYQPVDEAKRRHLKDLRNGAAAENYHDMLEMFAA